MCNMLRIRPRRAPFRSLGRCRASAPSTSSTSPARTPGRTTASTSARPAAQPKRDTGRHSSPSPKPGNDPTPTGACPTAARVCTSAVSGLGGGLRGCSSEALKPSGSRCAAVPGRAPARSGTGVVRPGAPRAGTPGGVRRPRGPSRPGPQQALRAVLEQATRHRRCARGAVVRTAGAHGRRSDTGHRRTFRSWSGARRCGPELPPCQRRRRGHAHAGAAAPRGLHRRAEQGPWC